MLFRYQVQQTSVPVLNPMLPVQVTLPNSKPIICLTANHDFCILIFSDFSVHFEQFSKPMYGCLNFVYIENLKAYNIIYASISDYSSATAFLTKSGDLLYTSSLGTSCNFQKLDLPVKSVFVAFSGSDSIYSIGENGELYYSHMKNSTQNRVFQFEKKAYDVSAGADFAVCVTTDHICYGIGSIVNCYDSFRPIQSLLNVKILKTVAKGNRCFALDIEGKVFCSSLPNSMLNNLNSSAYPPSSTVYSYFNPSINMINQMNNNNIANIYVNNNINNNNSNNINNNLKRDFVIVSDLANCFVIDISVCHLNASFIDSFKNLYDANFNDQLLSMQTPQSMPMSTFGYQMPPAYLNNQTQQKTSYLKVCKNMNFQTNNLAYVCCCGAFNYILTDSPRLVHPGIDLILSLDEKTTPSSSSTTTTTTTTATSSQSKKHKTSINDKLPSLSKKPKQIITPNSSTTSLSSSRKDTSAVCSKTFDDSAEVKEIYRLTEEIAKLKKQNENLQETISIQSFQIEELKIKKKNGEKTELLFLDENIIKSEYREIKQIGSGATSDIYQIEKREIFVKKVLRNITSDKVFQHFFGEFEMLSKLNHPFLVKAHGFCMSPPIIIMEYEPYNLEERFKDLDLTTKAKITIQIILGMRFIHSMNIMHRDLKPANILLTNDDNVKICDFGLAQLSNIESLTKGVGTLKFMAPEIFDEDESYSNKVDIWAFGVVLYYIMNNGVYPDIKVRDVLKGKKLPSIPNIWPHFVREIIHDCWNFDPEKRPTFDEIFNKMKKNEYAIFDKMNQLIVEESVKMIDNVEKSLKRP